MWNYLLIALTIMAISPICRTEVDSFLKLSKVWCQCPNATLCSITKCRLKPIRRNMAALSVNVRLIRRHVNDCMLNVDFYRKYTSYTSFPINFTVDACSFIKNTKKVPILHHTFQMLQNKTNFAHPCPYDEPYVYAENITAPYSPFFGFIPSGSYLIKTKWIVEGVVWTFVNVWVDVNNPDNKFLSK